MQTLMRVTLILGFTLAAIFAQDCMNPLLNRTDIQTRFGGSANILNTSRIAGNLSVCPFLSGQSVCVSDEGFASLKTFLEQYKSSFTERSQKADEHKFAGIGEAMNRTNMNGAKIKSMFTLGMLFNQTILSFNASGLTQPYNFTDFSHMVQQMRLSDNKTTGNKRDDLKEHEQVPHEDKESKEPKEDHSRGRGLEAMETANKSHNESGHKWILIDEWNKTNSTNGKNMTHRNPMNESSNMNDSRHHNETQKGNLRNLRATNEKRDMDSDSLHRDWMDLQQNLMQAKAKCATSVMKHMYFASCMAAASNVTTLNQSNSSNATMKISPNACSGFKSKCDDYFMYSAAADSTRAMVMNANSSLTVQLYAIVTSGNDSATINDELNTLATTVLAQMNTSDLSFVSHKNLSNPSNLPCNGTNSSASDCNYVCLRVLNTTGIDEDAFNNVSAANFTSRRSLGSTESITIDPTGANPDVVIDDGDSAVVVSVSSIPDSSSGSRVLASILTVISLALLLLSA